MKKALSLFLVLIICISMTACTVSSNSGNSNCSHTYSKISTEASCTEGGAAVFQCSKCWDRYSAFESALGHTTSNGKCSRCGQTLGGWAQGYYVDEFNMPTSDAYISNTDYFVGTFSNSATTDSLLYAKIAIDKDGIFIFLWEYGKNLVKYYLDAGFNITIREENGTKHRAYARMLDDRIKITDGDLITLLQRNDRLQIYMEESSKYGVNSTYLFTVTRGNFNSVYKDFYDTNNVNYNDFIGSTVVIYNPATGQYATTKQSSYTTVLDKTKYTLEVSSSQANAVELKIVADGEAIAFMTADGKYLSCDGFSLTYTSSKSEYTKFVLENANGGYLIRCYSATYDGVTPEYLDIYNDRLSCYSMQSDVVWQYIFQLKKVS